MRLLLRLAAPAAALAASIAAGASPGAVPEATVPPPVVVTSTADKTSVAVGEPVTLVYAARVPAGSKLRLTHLVSPARPEGHAATSGFVLDFEPVSPAVEEPLKGAGGLVELRQTVRLAAFLPGETRVPGPVLAYEAPDGTKAVLRPPAVALNVSSRLPEGQKPEELAPKPARPVRVPARGFWFWASVALAVLAVAGFAAWVVRRLRRKPAPEAVAAAPPPLPADAELEAALAALAERAASIDGDPRPFYSDLTHAAKRFLERHLGESVLEWTTFETVRRLRELGAEPPREVGLPDLLAGADRVKFGRAGATRAEAERALDGARHLLAWGRVRIAAQVAAARAAEKAARREPRPGAAAPAPARPPARAAGAGGRP